MANNNLDVNINVKLNGNEALGQLGEIKSNISNLGSNVTKDFSRINSSATSAGTGVKTAFNNALSGVSEKVRGISQSFSGLNGVMSSIMGTIGLGSFKSLTLDMAMTRDQAKNLLAVTMQGNSTFAEASATAGRFIDTIKEGTSGSVVKLQMMIEAMNGIKLSTGMANSDLESLNDVIRKVGEASLLMGDDTEHATFVMKEAMSGLNGDFAVLKEQFGITADKMKAAGWSGAAEDVQGYRKALEQCLSGLGDMGQVMDTTSGKINKIKSNFSSAGLEIGNQMLPAVDWVATAFLDANENGNLLAKGILYAGGAASTFAALAPSLQPMFDTYDSIKGAVDSARGATELLTGATETMDGITAMLTGTKTAEAAATEANAVAETTDAVAKGTNTVATEADAAANVTLTGAMSGAASSAWALTTALLANPWTWVVVAVVALVAILWHLYNTNESVRNAINQLAEDLKGGLINAWNTLQNVAQQVWKGLQTLGQHIWGMLIPAWNQLKTQTQPLISAFGKLYNTLSDLWSNLTGGSSAANNAGQAFNILATIGKIVGGVILLIVKHVITMGQIFMAILVPAITFVVNQLSTFISVISGVANVINEVMNGNMDLGQAFTAIGQIISQASSQILSNLQQLVIDIATNLGTVFTSIAPQLQMAVMNFVGNIGTWINQGMMQARIMAGLAVQGLVNAIVLRFNLLVARVRNVFSFVVNAIRSRLTQAGTIAGTLATRIRTVIQQRLQAVVNRVRAIFQSIVSNIRSRLSNAVSAARQKAQEIYQGIKDKITNIPQMVADEFGKIKDRISSALSNAASAAASGAAGIVSAFKGALGIASPGYVQRMTAAEFATLPEHIASSGSLAVNETTKMARGIVNAWSSNMDALSIPFRDVEQMADLTSIQSSAIPQFNAFTPSILGNYDTKVISSNVATTRGNNPDSTRNVNTYQDQQIRNIHIEKISLDCHDLTKQESRELLYNALDGLYTGGV